MNLFEDDVAACDWALVFLAKSKEEKKKRRKGEERGEGIFCCCPVGITPPPLPHVEKRGREMLT
jgi:hypothetical protein